MPVRILAVLAPEEIQPHDREPKRVGRFGGYKIGLALLGTAWLLGLWALFTVGRKKGGGDGEGAEGEGGSVVRGRA